MHPSVPSESSPPMPPRFRFESDEGSWSRLVAGAYRLEPSPFVEAGRGYRVVERAPAERTRAALSPREASVLEMTVRGAAGKHVAYSLGISPGSVTRTLSAIASRLALSSRTDLVIFASRVRGEPSAPRPKLTPAEERVLALVGAGLSNAEIARARGTSVRTIANQISSILQKTGRPTRRALIAMTAASS